MILVGKAVALFIVIIFYQLGLIPTNIDRPVEDIETFQVTTIVRVIGSSTFAALIEEIAFRTIPFYLVFFKEDFQNGNHRPIWVMGVMSSIMFGYLHGGLPQIFIQGISGFVYWIIFFENYKICHNLVKPTIITTLLHAGSNFILLILIILPQNIGTKKLRVSLLAFELYILFT